MKKIALGLYQYLRKKISKSTEAPPQFIIISPMYNVEKWIEKTIYSIQSQSYPNFKVALIDDISTDKTFEMAKKLTKDDPRFTLIKNTKKKYMILNHIDALKELQAKEEDIILTLDGDDWLAHDQVLETLKKTYHKKKCWLTYGNFKEYPSNAPSFISPIKFREKLTGSYRNKDWNLSHLRTFKYFLFKKINPNDLKDKTGKYYKITGDIALMLPMAEMAGTHVEFIPEVLYIYNRENPQNDDKVNLKLQVDTCKEIMQKQHYPILIR